MTTDKPLAGVPGYRPMRNNEPVPVIRFYGVTKEGHSVMARVHGFMPYFWVPSPPGLKESQIDDFRAAFNRALERNHNLRQAGYHGNEPCLAIGWAQKESIMGFHNNKKLPFLRITMAMPRLVATGRNCVENGFHVNGLGDVALSSYESNVPFVLRFMIDQDVVGGNWLEIPAGMYKLHGDNTKESHCQIEASVCYKNLISHSVDEPQWQGLAPLRILSFDIECAGRKGVFPEAEKDPVIQIANLVTRQGEDHPIVRNVFCLRQTSGIVGAKVYCFDDERDLLVAWSKMVIDSDPDIITGYNINGFDLPYLMNRAAALKCKEAFYYLGRLRGEKSRLKTTKFSSKAYGTKESFDVEMAGRVRFDMMSVIQRDYKLSSYSLNSVSAHFLGQQKEDVAHGIITDLWNGTDDDRRRLAVYCLKDAYLPQRLMGKLMCLYNYIEMSRVTGVPFSYLLSRGQSIKVLSQIYRHCKRQDLLIPFSKGGGVQSEVGYEGATVISPKKGYYKMPIATLDFSSLYPSIMMAHNLCYTTLTSKSAMLAMPDGDVLETPSKNHFVKAHVRKGLLPQILEDLLSARKRAKRDLANEKDPFKRAVLDGRQLALKISANSVYGFTGATIGQLPCLEISASVTAFGRQMIDSTKKLVMEKYNIANGYAHDADVVYGDTDSVMVKFGCDTVAEAMELGKEAAAYVTATFERPIGLEFEKVYYPYLLMNKKRYAGLYWTRPDKYDKMDCKGIETVRRDNCQLVKRVIGESLNKLLIDQDVEGAMSFVKSVISDLLRNKIDLSQLVITKALVKKNDDYANKQAHAELAERMRIRDPATAPQMGDRVPYVIKKGAKGAKAYELAEDPLYALEHNIPLDVNYYLDNQLSKPLMRLFEPIMENAKSLLRGEHTRTISIPTPTTGGIMSFAVKRRSCMKCRAALSGSEGTLCKHCEPFLVEVYEKKLSEVTALEEQFSRVWTKCQACQGDFHKTVLCTSRDCPIFYMRKKIAMDLSTAQTTLQRFHDEDW
eukprot:TRINITY_DN17448_c0_g1_i1.p1 TRINITY_DN17448_c0_g1~~TRINITY_DN17448_c0_g1_i1.p1  ORF type:complete len:1124 (+),score=279.27 TRINITY_DN17448_c0_g1_i1:349-3372(+)